MSQPLRVLIVEDSELDAMLLLHELRRGGYDPAFQRVQTADAMRSALEAQAWDVVVSDYSMPHFNATGALSVVKAMSIDVPFIIVSGTIGEETAVEAMRAGAKDFVIKGKLARLVPIVEREVREAGRRRDRIAERARNDAERERLLGELREAVEARDTLLSMVAHELRTPLSSLELQLQLLRRAELPAPMSVETTEEQFGVIARQVARLRTLIANLLDVALITSNQLTLDRQHVDLGGVVTEVLAQSRLLMTHAKSEMSVAAQRVVGVWDRVRLESVVANLISNALKFGEGQPIEVAVSGDGQRARLAVTDHGIGLSPKQQDRIFGKFERAVSEWQYGGLGLGLWVARQIVEAHGGTISVASELRKGSTFAVELPLDL